MVVLVMCVPVRRETVPWAGLGAGGDRVVVGRGGTYGDGTLVPAREGGSGSGGARPPGGRAGPGREARSTGW
ncbi:hypothetical protein GCM10022244_16360 [Streptomyces gulbargensis]|uniref:Secreted protein n=1 Tax=Streptomyces gulbargensis TaxID=364901 RepID=A0ABP7LSX4_9ACTN